MPFRITVTEIKPVTLPDIAKAATPASSTAEEVAAASKNWGELAEYLKDRVLAAVGVRWRPILFSAPMVRAILAGAKSQTRRVLKPMAGQQKGWLTPELLNRSPAVSFTLTSSRDGPRDPGVQLAHPRGGPLGWIRSPFGGPGDRLWVRETWAPNPLAPVPDRIPYVLYRANSDGDATTKWKPSIFMRRHSSRIALEITDVRVEHVQDITPFDCRAEGMPEKNNDAGVRYCFEQLWNEINEARGFGWDANPWVWCLSFKRV